jgi:hypothetical protein
MHINVALLSSLPIETLGLRSKVYVEYVVAFVQADVKRSPAATAG